MLIVNWKKHYYVPSLFYNDARFTSTRKGKFFFLSDFVFRIIHKFCFRLCLFYYVKYLFFYRFQKLCLNINKFLFSSSFFLKQDFFKALVNIFYLSLKIKNNNTINKKIFLKKKFLIHFNFLVFLLLKLKSNFLKIKNKYFIFLNLYFSFNNFFFMNYFFKYILHTFYSIIKIRITKNSFIYYNKNVLFLLYQILTIRNTLKSYNLYFNSVSYLCLIFKGYMKNFFFENNISFNFLLNKYDLIKLKHNSFFDSLKIKNLFYFTNSWKKNYVIYLNYFINNFHNLLSYFFSLKKLKTYKSLNFLNYVSLNNLILKKDLFFRFRKQFKIFKNKFRKYRLRYMWKFYKFLKRILYVKKNWLLGPVHKIKFFKYLFIIYRKIKNTFKKLFFLNNPYSKRKKKLSFFFNSTKIREHFFIYLGKRRYSEEFILLKNKKWYFKFYLKQYYNVNLKFFLSFYFNLRKKFKVKLLKDLFLFLEYNILVFTTKYIFYSFSFFYNTENSISLNNNLINLNNNNIFFIGDLIQINSLDLKFKFYYEKLFIFFNVIYYINPFFFKKKASFLFNMYLKLFSYIYQKFNNFNFSFFSKKDENHISFSNNDFHLLKITKKYISFFIHKLRFYLDDFKYYKFYIKSLFFFLYKYNLFFIFKKNKSSFFNNKYLLLNDINITTLIYIYSFDKTFNKYSLVKFTHFKKQIRKKIKKRFRFFNKINWNKIFWRRTWRTKIKKSLDMNIYNFFKYHNFSNTKNNKVKISFYNNIIYKKLNKNNHNIWLLKKFFFLNRKKKLINFYYTSNF